MSEVEVEQVEEKIDDDVLLRVRSRVDHDDHAHAHPVVD